MAERFWSKAERTEGCWEWQGVLHPKGYAYFRLGGKSIHAHRVAYELSHGPIDDGMQVDHICMNRACVRPDHLRLSTNKQNGEHKGVAQNNRSGYRGVSWFKSGQKWRAEVRHNGKLHYLGLFTTAEEANQAAIAKRNELYTHNNLDRITQ